MSEMTITLDKDDAYLILSRDGSIEIGLPRTMLDEKEMPGNARLAVAMSEVVVKDKYYTEMRKLLDEIYVDMDKEMGDIWKGVH